MWCKYGVHASSETPGDIIGAGRSKSGKIGGGTKVNRTKIGGGAKVFTFIPPPIFPDLLRSAPTNCPWVSEDGVYGLFRCIIKRLGNDPSLIVVVHIGGFHLL